MRLTPNTHHSVREAMVGATIIKVTHEVRAGHPDCLRLTLDKGKNFVLRIVIAGEPLDLHFDKRAG